MVDFVMPSLGADMESGTITEWMIKPGDRVGRGDIVAVVETDKADIDIEIWDPGVVVEIIVPVGETVTVGTPLARLATGAPSEDSPPETATTPALTSTAAPTSTRHQAVITEDRLQSDRLPASPLARRLAGERGLDLEQITGTGPGGARLARDLPPKPSGPTAKATERDGTRMRRMIGDLMARSKREVPHYYLETTVDLEAALCWLQAKNTDQPVEKRVIPAAVMLKAVATALSRHPEFNGHWTDDEFRPAPSVHLGVAVSLRAGGVVAPAILDADQLSLNELMSTLKDLVDRARSGRLRASEMTDATVTVTNLGDRGVEVVHGVIHPPQVCLFGIGRPTLQPAVIDGEVVARRQVIVTLAADHRASDGQRGARLLNTIAHLLQKPEEL